MNTIATAPSPPETAALRARAVAYALLARLLGPDTGALAAGSTVGALRTALAAAGEASALARIGTDGTLGTEGTDGTLDAEALAGRWVRWFELGRVAPYEGSNVTASAGGITPRLADVAGFYRAFGTRVPRERPDHVVAQLEFLAVALLAEADALERGDADAVDTCAGATRTFVRDHAGVWIETWAARVGGVDELAPWAPLAAAAATLVASEAAHRNVIPLRESPALPVDAGVADDGEADLSCGDDLDLAEH